MSRKKILFYLFCLHTVISSSAMQKTDAKGNEPPSSIDPISHRAHVSFQRRKRECPQFDDCLCKSLITCFFVPLLMLTFLKYGYDKLTECNKSRKE